MSMANAEGVDVYQYRGLLKSLVPFGFPLDANQTGVHNGQPGVRFLEILNPMAQAGSSAHLTLGNPRVKQGKAFRYIWFQPGRRHGS